MNEENREKAEKIEKTEAVEITENRKLICALWTILCVGCMAVMLAFASNKSIVIADAAQNPTELGQGPGSQGNPAEHPIGVAATTGVRKRFSIRLPKEVKAEQVVMENRYVNRELLLYIEGAKLSFFEENGISGDVSPVRSASGQIQNKGVLLKIQMNRVLEYKSTMEGNTLTIEWYEPRELYDYIVVLDTAGGSDDLKDGVLTLRVARLAQQKFDMQKVRLYLLSMEDTEVADTDKVGLAEELQADLYIRLSAAYDGERPESYGIKGMYNEEYYIPGFGNVELADIMTRAVTIASSNRAVGLERAGEESILRSLRMPAAELSLGYLSNTRESNLLWQESYQGRLADGVVNGIKEAVRQLEMKEENLKEP